MKVSAATLRAWKRACALGPMTLVAAAAHAQVWTHEASLQARAVATDNSRPGTDSPKEADLLVSVQPGVRVAAAGAALNLDLEASVAFVESARGTVDSSVQPRVDGALAATLVPRLLFLDAAVGVHQAAADPFGARVADASSENRRTAADYRLAPVLRWQFGPRAQLFARHEESLHTNAAVATATSTDAPDAPGADLRGHRSTLRIEREPVPMGASLEFDRDDSRTEGPSIDQRVTLEAARASLSYAFSAADLVLGVVGGHESGTVQQAEVSDSVYGVTAHWAPSERTDAAARVEHRFFGTGGDLSVRWRSPMSSLSLRAHRGPASASTPTIDPGMASEAATQAAALAARDAGPGAEAPAAVPARWVGEAVLGRRGLTASLPELMVLAAGYPQIESGLEATWVLLGRRDTITLQGFSHTLRRYAVGQVDTPTAAGGDSRQAGGAFSLMRRLSPTESLDFTFSVSRIDGLNERAGDRTTQGDARLSFVSQLSPRTTLSLSLQFERLRSNVGGVGSSDATGLSAGLFHRF